MKSKSKPKRVDEVVWLAVPTRMPEVGSIPWSVGISHYDVLDKMRDASWPRRHYRIARCRLVEIKPKRIKTNGR